MFLLVNNCDRKTTNMDWRSSAVAANKCNCPTFWNSLFYLNSLFVILSFDTVWSFCLNSDVQKFQNIQGQINFFSVDNTSSALSMFLIYNQILNYIFHCNESNLIFTRINIYFMLVKYTILPKMLIADIASFLLSMF